MDIANLIIESRKKKSKKIDRESFEIKLETEKIYEMPCCFLSKGDTIKIW